MSEQEPVLHLQVEGGPQLEVTPRNGTLYTFLGKTSIGDMELDNSQFNHAFLQTGQNERGQATGMYFFRMHPAYRQISEFMTDNRFPMVLNQRQVAECDMRAYFENVDAQAAQFASTIPDEIPEK